MFGDGDGGVDLDGRIGENTYGWSERGCVGCWILDTY